MNLDNLHLDAIRDGLVRGAKALGVSVEEHAANRLHALEAKYGKIVVIGFPLAFVIGFVLGRVL